VLDAVEAGLLAQGTGQVVLEPREHLVPDPAFNGHFNVLRGYVAPLDVAGVKVVGDYHGNYKLGLRPSWRCSRSMTPAPASRARSSTPPRSPSGAPVR
jgi:ornithine cyclodeaminase/alanine dehydrogenase-like protein (mu-crystallin family)